MKSNAIVPLLVCISAGCNSQPHDSAAPPPPAVSESRPIPRDIEQYGVADDELNTVRLNSYSEQRKRLEEVIKLQEQFLQSWQHEQSDAEARKNVGFLVDANRRARYYDAAITKAKSDLREVDRRIEILKTP